MLIYRSNPLGIAAPAPRVAPVAPPKRSTVPHRRGQWGQGWSAEEVAIVIAAPIRGHALARRLGRNPSSLRNLVEKLRLKGLIP